MTIIALYVDDLIIATDRVVTIIALYVDDLIIATQIESIHYSETYTLVARFTSIRIVLALAAMCGYVVYQMDVDTAFLNAEL